MQRRKPSESLSSKLSVKAIRNRKLSGLKGLVIIFNSESCYHYFTNPDFRNVVNRCEAVCIDGIGVALAMRLRGHRATRYHGPDVLSDLVQSGQAENFTLIGGSEEISEVEVCSFFRSHVSLPRSNNVPYLFDITRQCLERHDHSNSKFLVSLGLPKQELFSAYLISYLQSKGPESVIIPIGAAIDFHFGYKVRSSTMWQYFGLEWLPRLLREPRMFPRILRSLGGVFLLLLGR